MPLRVGPLAEAWGLSSDRHRGPEHPVGRRFSAQAFGEGMVGMVGFHPPEAVVETDGDTAKTIKGADQTAKGKTARSTKRKAAATA